MMRQLKFLKAYKLKNSQRHRKIGGFTLIELLVGMILVSLIITPLLGFVINMMDTDRKEQAKATSEQEIQAALDYIARDLDQAFFIYDGAGLSAIDAQLPQVAAANPGQQGEPVLVFWKREFLPKAVPLKDKNITDCTSSNDPDCDDGFVHSLVAYYLIKDTGTNCNNSPWSCTTRISRIELKDTLYNVNNPINGESQPIAGYEASDGLVPLDQLLEQPGSLQDQLTDWGNVDWGEVRDRDRNYDYSQTQFVTLIDYIDQGPPEPNFQPPCSDQTQQVPVSINAQFYACVTSDQTIAQVFIRGNALARLRPKNQVPTYEANQSAYFPRASIQAQGRGLLNVNPSQ